MCVQSFHMVNIDVPAGVGAPPLDTTSDWKPSAMNVQVSSLGVIPKQHAPGQKGDKGECKQQDWQ